MDVALVVHDFDRNNGQGRYCLELVRRLRDRCRFTLYANTADPAELAGVTWRRVPAWRRRHLTAVFTFLAAAENLTALKENKPAQKQIVEELGLRSLPDSLDGLLGPLESNQEQAKMLRQALVSCILKRAESNTTAKGFTYGISCQQREAGWTPSTKTSKAEKLTTPTAKIYETLLRHWRTVESFTKQKKSSREIAGYVANLTPFGAIPLAEYLKRYPDKNEIYIQSFQKLCGRVGIPLPPRGGVRKKRRTV